jgi:predicted Zn-dependent protease
MHTARILPGLAAAFLLSCASGPSTTDADPPKQQPGDAAGEPVDMNLELGEAAADDEPDDLLKVMQEEADRIMAADFGDPKYPAYYLSYQVTENRSRNITASFGAIDVDSTDHDRNLDTVVRVGSYQLDNTHELRGEWYGDYAQSGRLPFPLTYEPAWRTLLWRSTDSYYIDAVERFIKVRANYGLKAPEEDTSADFTKVEPIRHIQSVPDFKADHEAWREHVRELSDIFSDYDHVERSNVSFSEGLETRYQVNSEGAMVRKVRHVGRVSWFASTSVEDGMNLYLYDSVDVYDPEQLPSRDELAPRIEETAKQLEALLKAPKAEPFIGPAILEGEAAGVFFHEALGHRVEGHRQADEDEGQTFAEKIGQQVLPTFLDVYDDPRLISASGTPLMGHYLVDDQAVPAQRATVVDDGIFKGFLMSRTPIEGFEESNGHGRREPGKHVVSRQGNLVIHPSKTVSRAKLKEMLIEEIEAQDAPYGLRFERVQGGFTLTGRGLPQAFKVLPLVVYRVYPDGSEELIRGVTLEGTPLTVLSEIAAAADDVKVFNGLCGAESGHVPVSSVSPTLLVRRVETARAPKGSERPPILGPPPEQPGGEPNTSDTETKKDTSRDGGEQ